MTSWPVSRRRCSAAFGRGHEAGKAPRRKAGVTDFASRAREDPETGGPRRRIWAFVGVEAGPESAPEVDVGFHVRVEKTQVGRCPGKDAT